MLDPRITQILGEFAMMTATEYTELDYKRSRVSNFYMVHHSIGFVRTDGVWKMASDILDDTGSIEPVPYDRKTLQSIKGLVAPISPSLGTLVDPQNVETPGSAIRGLKLSSATIPLEPTQVGNAYNGNAAAGYALKWSSRRSILRRITFHEVRNPDYPAYPYDCTNFGSQVLRAGGWKDDALNGWYARDGAPTLILSGAQGVPPTPVVRKNGDTGPAWRLANELYKYGRYTSHRFIPYDGNRASLGDIFAADWTKADESYGYDGSIDHIMIVTTLGNGTDWHTVQVTYHSSDNQNMMMNDVVLKQADGKDPNLMRFYFMHPIA
jgi:hypothetical protein